MRISILALIMLLSNPSFSSIRTKCSQSLAAITEDQIHTQFQKFISRYGGNRSSLNFNESLALYRSLIQSPVTSLNRLGIYDPEGVIGFCFGRSFAAYLFATRMGLKVNAIKNLFMIGDLRSQSDPEWRFHVTSVIQLEDGGWYAFDPAMPQNRPIPVAEWVSTTRSIWDKENRAQIYVTSPFHIAPDIRNMAKPGQETGNDIIDLSFDPKSKPGIKKSRLLGRSLKNVIYYEISDSAHPYFLQVHPDQVSSFNFEFVMVNDLKVSFNDYFSDLFKSLLDPKWNPRPEIVMATGQSASAMTPIKPSRLGMIFDERFWKKQP